MDALLIGIAFFASLLILHLSGFRLLGINAHPLAFLIWIQIFVLTLVGTLGLGVFGLPMAYGADAAISEETRSEVIFLTFWSMIVFFLGLACLFGLKVLRPLNYQVREDDSELLSKLTTVSVIIIFVKLIFVSEIPLLLVLSGDLHAYDLAADGDQLQRLLHGKRRVHGVAGEHGLLHHGMIASDDDAALGRIADDHFTRQAAMKNVGRRTVLHRYLGCSLGN